MGSVSTKNGLGWRLVELPQIPDHRGNLTFVEGTHHIPFQIAGSTICIMCLVGHSTTVTHYIDRSSLSSRWPGVSIFILTMGLSRKRSPCGDPTMVFTSNPWFGGQWTISPPVPYVWWPVEHHITLLITAGVMPNSYAYPSRVLRSRPEAHCPTGASVREFNAGTARGRE